jgi:two-component system nitrate/nitrite sensor histidine kinase NarX
VDGSPVALTPEVTLDVLRIVQESLSNVGRHAQASHVQVKLASNANGIQIMVQDDGLGFDPAEAGQRTGCFGLVGMEERAERMGATLKAKSGRGQGTTVILQLEGASE